ncbi:MAG: hypothetical protein DRP26_05445 [Candidatus Zixiibacteriota bacterium]|nr:MAG: hypothetical protein DRP26_05445 [candidate division Zixibacteria bacterium]
MEANKHLTIKKAVTLVELMVAASISILLIGATLSLLLFGRASVFRNEASVQAGERARKVANIIAKELRISKPTKVFISDSLGTTSNTNSGSVINFQIPVGAYNTSLTLNADYSLKWGSEDTEDEYIGYSINGDFNLIRSTYSTSTASDAVSEVVSPDINSLLFTRDNTSSPVINIEVEMLGKSFTHQETVTITSSVRTRN